MRWYWRPTVSRFHPQSRRGGAGVRCCTPNPKRSRCARSGLPGAQTGLSQEEKVRDNFAQLHNLIKNSSKYRKSPRCCYRRSRRGRCWDWGCSSTEWSRRHPRWNTAPPCCSSPHSVQHPCGLNCEIMILICATSTNTQFDSSQCFFLPVGPESVDRFHI